MSSPGTMLLTVDAGRSFSIFSSETIMANGKRMIDSSKKINILPWFLGDHQKPGPFFPFIIYLFINQGSFYELSGAQRNNN